MAGCLAIHGAGRLITTAVGCMCQCTVGCGSRVAHGWASMPHRYFLTHQRRMYRPGFQVFPDLASSTSVMAPGSFKLETHRPRFRFPTTRLAWDSPVAAFQTCLRCLTPQSKKASLTPGSILRLSVGIMPVMDRQVALVTALGVLPRVTSVPLGT